jgi:hypothetical protein
MIRSGLPNNQLLVKFGWDENIWVRSLIYCKTIKSAPSVWCLVFSSHCWSVEGISNFHWWIRRGVDWSLPHTSAPWTLSLPTCSLALPPDHFDKTNLITKIKCDCHIGYVMSPLMVAIIWCLAPLVEVPSWRTWSHGVRHRAKMVVCEKRSDEDYFLLNSMIRLVLLNRPAATQRTRAHMRERALPKCACWPNIAWHTGECHRQGPTFPAVIDASVTCSPWAPANQPPERHSTMPSVVFKTTLTIMGPTFDLLQLVRPSFASRRSSPPYLYLFAAIPLCLCGLSKHRRCSCS